MRFLAVVALALLACGQPPVTRSSRGVLVVSIEGQEAEPAVEQTIDLGAVAVGTERVVVVRATNIGDDTMRVYGASLGADNGAWFVRNTGGMLEPEQSLTVTVTFQPVGVGAQSTQLLFTHDAAAASPRVSLSGTGT